MLLFRSKNKNRFGIYFSKENQSGLKVVLINIEQQKIFEPAKNTSVEAMGFKSNSSIMYFGAN